MYLLILLLFKNFFLKNELLLRKKLFLFNLLEKGILFGFSVLKKVENIKIYILHTYYFFLWYIFLLFIPLNTLFNPIVESTTIIYTFSKSELNKVDSSPSFNVFIISL